MLSDILFASVRQETKTDRPSGLSCSSLFPCPYFMYKVQSGDIIGDPPTPQQILNMANGWTQEEESVQILKEIAGVSIKERQTTVSVGKSCIPGHIDGTVNLDGKERLWEHKAWATSRYDWFVSHGIQAFPAEKTQVNAYMLGMGLDECIFFVKKKENNDYHDELVRLNKSFILPIIEWADRIRLDGWTPQPKLCVMCVHCRLRCFGEVVDFSHIDEAKAPEMAEKWKQGKKLMDVGGMLVEEARTFFVGDRSGKTQGLIRDKEVLLIEDLKITKIISHRFDIKKDLVLKEFGTEGLVKVGQEKEVVSYRIMEV